jgi:hypothetical protein
MSKCYYIELDDKLGRKLKSVEKSDVIAALEEVADDHADSDELSEYSSVREIRNNSSISEAEKRGASCGGRESWGADTGE